MRASQIVMSGVLFAASSCLTATNPATYRSLTPIALEVPNDEVQLVTELMQRHGFAAAPIRSKDVLVFRGEREVISRFRRAPVEVGSVFWVELHPRGQVTELRVRGQPTVDGLPLCTDQRLPWPVTCSTISTDLAEWHATGAEAQQVLSLVSLELVRSHHATLTSPPSWANAKR